MKKFYIILFVILVVGYSVYRIVLKNNHDDGKCDICGKYAVYSSDSCEYCSECVGDALGYALTH